MINIINTKNLDIFFQLKLEEFLLKTSDKNYCIINHKSPSSIILGVSNKKQDLIDLKKAQNDKVRIIKRFTGGGTVYTDENTIFVSFIFSKSFLNLKNLFPENILSWSENFYKKVFKNDNFKLIENDFTIKNKKIAGNALYIKKGRFLLHSSFLKDFDIEKINKYLLFPKKIPNYRKKRSHSEFLTKLSEHYRKDFFIEALLKALKDSFLVNPININDIDIYKDFPFSTENLYLKY